VKGHNSNSRTKRFFRHDQHLMGCVGKNGGFEKIAFLELFPGRPLAAADQTGAFAQGIFRATTVRKAVNDDKAAHERGLSGQMHAIFVIKEHLLMAWSQLRKFFVLFIRNYGHMTITTA
jgi:hypothetical protein